MRGSSREWPRRAADVGLAAVFLVVTSPLMLLAAASVLVGMGKPILFQQVRVGREGRLFRILKFRTMTLQRYPDEPDHLRVTSIGRVLRRASLDELPQLVNVLRGEMSFIGPRPATPELASGYDTFQQRRLEVRPGLTGWAQVCGRNRLQWTERIELDVWYIDHRNAWLDARIVLRTIPAIFSRDVAPAGAQEGPQAQRRGAVEGVPAT